MTGEPRAAVVPSTRVGDETGPQLRIVPVSFAAASEFVAEHHRHHAPPVGHKFSVGIASEDHHD